MRVSPDQQRVKRKWGVDRSAGPVLALASLVQKKLIQHSFPCDVEPEARFDEIGLPEEPRWVEFVPIRGRPAFGPDFMAALSLALHIVSDEQKVHASLDGVRLGLVGRWVLDERGKFRPAPEVPF